MSFAANTPPSFVECKLMELAWGLVRILTKGVSFGPQMSASQVKKSDSEIGPFGREITIGRGGVELMRANQQ